MFAVEDDDKDSELVFSMSEAGASHRVLRLRGFRFCSVTVVGFSKCVTDLSEISPSFMGFHEVDHRFLTWSNKKEAPISKF